MVGPSGVSSGGGGNRNRRLNSPEPAAGQCTTDLTWSELFTQALDGHACGLLPVPCPLSHESEAKLARMWGSAPIPSGSGKTDKNHRLHRGGDRQANSALWRIAMVRMSNDPRTRAYVDRRTKEGLSKREILRCLKRYIVREIYRELHALQAARRH